MAGGYEEEPWVLPHDPESVGVNLDHRCTPGVRTLADQRQRLAIDANAVFEFGDALVDRAEERLVANDPLLAR